MKQIRQYRRSELIEKIKQKKDGVLSMANFRKIVRNEPFLIEDNVLEKREKAICKVVHLNYQGELKCEFFNLKKLDKNKEGDRFIVVGFVQDKERLKDYYGNNYLLFKEGSHIPKCRNLEEMIKAVYRCRYSNLISADMIIEFEILIPEVERRYLWSLL